MRSTRRSHLGVYGCAGAGSGELATGYKATTHWMSLDLLALLGVEVVNEHVVRDRNRFTSDGVTGGIDFSLVLATELRSQVVARSIQLTSEYNPEPPFDSGSLKTSTPALVEQGKAEHAKGQQKRREIVEWVAKVVWPERG